ncbi:hypothetical protein PIIN_10978 [Serendipita indica DSM 11827]|uniref:Uncharacterized protein n=1 Tax=Serendipita indica (strain DSM 11827) TaxID=1109443 RepID=G4U0A0_SERID|nr:hypothetical protein PIIN_10978 [Serendipita indica DSM 11827]
MSTNSLCDSGHGQSFKSFVQQAWSFPALRALVLQASDIHLPENAMKKWRCPSLTMFKYMFRRLNELEIHGNGTAHWHVAENWRRLIALKSYAFDSLEILAEGTPFHAVPLVSNAWGNIASAAKAAARSPLGGLT